MIYISIIIIIPVIMFLYRVALLSIQYLLYLKKYIKLTFQCMKLKVFHIYVRLVYKTNIWKSSNTILIISNITYHTFLDYTYLDKEDIEKN